MRGARMQEEEVAARVGGAASTALPMRTVKQVFCESRVWAQRVQRVGWGRRGEVGQGGRRRSGMTQWT